MWCLMLFDAALGRFFRFFRLWSFSEVELIAMRLLAKCELIEEKGSRMLEFGCRVSGQWGMVGRFVLQWGGIAVVGSGISLL